MKYIPLEECKPKIIYRIAARNFSVGIYDPESELPRPKGQWLPASFAPTRGVL